LLASAATQGCGRLGPFSQGGTGQKEGPAESAPEGACPTARPAPEPLPGVRPEHRTLAYWIARAPSPDEPVLSEEDVRHHVAAFEARAAAHPEEPVLGHADLLAPPNRERLFAEIRERLAFVETRARDGTYVDADGKRLDEGAMAALAPPRELGPIAPSLRRALAPVALRCVPRAAPLYKAPEVDHAFDRNACSTVRAEEPLQILARHESGMMLARGRYAFGWIAPDAALSPPLSADEALATTRGAPPRALTRRLLLEEAFRYLGTPYGWGDHGGGRDCSRFLMDVFESFGVHLPRHSAEQARAGSMRIDVSKPRSRRDKLALLDAAHARGIVLLHFPGHIMLYLGRNAEGAPMALHAFAEYLAPCGGGGAVAAAIPSGSAAAAGAPVAGRETLHRVDKIQVSDLELGAGTSRGSFLERIATLTLFAATPGPALLGAVERRPPAPLVDEPQGECKDSRAVALYVSPRHPHPGEPVRVIATAERDLGSVEIALASPRGVRHVPALRRLGGPPFGYWAALEAPEPGRWTARIGEGGRVEACTELTVHERALGRQAGGGPVWHPARRWTRATENLYASFIEQLFDYPVEEELTWNNLQQLVGDPARNILFNHLGQKEDARLRLTPDCADLPYTLRAYFAWKMRLPFAFRHCSRGGGGRPPSCGRELHGCLDEREANDETDAFASFARRSVGDGVHSGTARTASKDEHTDLYPVPLAREHVLPGATYADPYGHTLIVVDWVPQSATSYGLLLAAEGQPDGTIGRRRFWRGSFLFEPDIAEAGPGFKAFRPVRHVGGELRMARNAELDGSDGFAPFSLEQYELGKDGFYDRMESLINPRPLEAETALVALLDALEEQVRRRVLSVALAEDHKAKSPATMAMPRGHAVFETSGPWEDFSTPSRDMRLLIAMDTVHGFTGGVRRNPARFGLEPGELDRATRALEEKLASELGRRRFEYKRSDGSSQSLSLADVMARAKGFEMAYNPNDCPELRWGAPEGSAELATCKRRAPADQRQKMEKYRVWFAERRRPSRGSRE
jgi:hypothetical protein